MEWQNIASATASIITIITAMGALTLSYRVYLRQKSIENENHFFSYKMAKYEVVIQQAIELHDLYYDSFLTIKHLLQQNKITGEDSDSIADKIDLATSQFRLTLFKHGAFLPEEILLRLDSFYNNLYDETETIENETIAVNSLDQLLDRLNKYEEDLEDTINLMRKDLNIDAIDRKLKSRTHK